MKTLEELAAETFPVGNETCPSKILTAKYNQAKMVKAVAGWIGGNKCFAQTATPGKFKSGGAPMPNPMRNPNESMGDINEITYI